MFARTVFSAARCARQQPTLKQNVRRYATEAPKSGSSNTLLYTLLAAGAGGAAYYYYPSLTGAAKEVAPKELPPAIPTFTGEPVELRLANVEQLSRNTKRYTFELPSPDHVAGMKVASCLVAIYQPPGADKPVIRPYTPVTDDDSRGKMEFVIKSYEKGNMSQVFNNMNVDQRMKFKGPFQKYLWEPNKHDHITLIAGGTGITPMYQLIRAIFKNPEDKTDVTLVFGNLSEEDILLKKELAELENTYPQRFRTFYVLDNAPKDAGWATQGYITKELLKTVLPEPGKGNNKIFVCGPPPMEKAVSGPKKSPSDQGEVSGILKELGYSKDEVYKF